MLPSKGYFKSYNCPFYENGQCLRPHCHFRHTKKERQESQKVPTYEKTEVPPNKWLADEGGGMLKNLSEFINTSNKYFESGEPKAFTPENSVTETCDTVKNPLPTDISSTSASKYERPLNVPSYKPTPISELKRRHIPVTYSPSLDKSCVSTKSHSSKKPKIEYVPKSINGSKPTIVYNPTPSGQTRVEKQEYTLSALSLSPDYTPSRITEDYHRSNMPNTDSQLTSTGKIFLSQTTMDIGDDILDFITPEMDMLGQILDDDKRDQEESKRLLGVPPSGCEKSKGHVPDSSALKETTALKIDELNSKLKKDDVKRRRDHKKSVSPKDKTSSSCSTKPHSKSAKIKTDMNSSASSSSKNKSHQSSSSRNNIKSKRGESKPSTSNKTVSEQKNIDCSKNSSASYSKYKNPDSSSSSFVPSKRKLGHSKTSVIRDDSNRHSLDKEKPSSLKEKSTLCSHSNIKRRTDNNHRTVSSKSSSGKRSSSSAKNHSSKSSSRHSRSGNRAHSGLRDNKESDGSSDVEEVPVVLPESIIITDSSDDSSEHVPQTSYDSSPPYQSEEEVPVHVQTYAEVSALPGTSGKIRVAHSLPSNGRPLFRQMPPIPKKPVSASPSQSLLKRWQTANQEAETERALITESASGNLAAAQATGQRVRIAHVPNVSSLLTAKRNIFSRQSEPCRLGLRVDQPSTSTAQTALPTTPTAIPTKATCPLVAAVDSNRIPMLKRQSYLNKVFDLYIQIYKTDVAKIKAVNAEKELCVSCRSTTTYVNKIAQLCISLKKEVGMLTGTIPCVTEEEEDVSMPSYTYGKSLYECMEMYLMTDLEAKGIPVPHLELENTAKMRNLYGVSSFSRHMNLCLYCKQDFEVNERGFSTDSGCVHHPGKKFKGRGKFGITVAWRCCNGEENSEGCQENRYHVRDMTNYDNMPGFRSTSDSQESSHDSNNVFAIDCEMCYTTNGCELTRCTVIDTSLKTVYDELCIPNAPIIDYCTRFSGITEEKLRDVTTTLEDIQNNLLGIFNSNTILVGHGIGNDLKAVKILHDRIVDTSDIFRHKAGDQFKRRLCDITKEFLQREIQNKETGHDSTEDAVACMELMLYKIKEDRKVFKPRTVISVASKRRGDQTSNHQPHQPPPTN